MRTITIAATHLAIVGLLVCGCSSSDGLKQQQMNGIRKLPTAQADELSAEHSHFERSEDPPISADTYFAAGQLAESQNQSAHAMEQYRQALRVDPKHQPSLYRIAVLYTQAKQYSQAIDTWKQYARATNDSATAYSNLAFCYELAQQPAEAEQAYKTGISHDPSNQPCRINYGLMLARNGRRDEAITQLSAVLKPAEVHYNLASVYEQLGQKDQARKEYNAALKLDPTLWEARARLAKID